MSKPERARRGEEAGAYLKETAIDCFARYGYQGTSIDRIAREAGVTKGAIYYHYKDKNDLLLAEQGIDAMARTVSQAGEGTDRDVQQQGWTSMLEALRSGVAARPWSSLRACALRPPAPRPSACSPTSSSRNGGGSRRSPRKWPGPPSRRGMPWRSGPRSPGKANPTGPSRCGA